MVGRRFFPFGEPVTFQGQAVKLQGCNFGTPRISGETCKRSLKQLPGKQVAVNFHPLYPQKAVTVVLKKCTFLSLPGS